MLATLAETLFARPSDQPLQHSIQVGFFFGADAVTTHLAVSYSFEV